ncbi:alpha-2 adrenergic receptor [Strongylocentrotus purpuratus]|uniref:G-protein coupled receptors family 1 profile domain-containing protein n=1 Tax=Strongylocentrotus purpuratus TaxID=7668 RepID=A0A7M7GJL1_STRPU|nr:alpha-2 adrenergic receptor [Strongylocentrotus purpuratus]|eukprot:XP_003730981.1 PREDICTED: alpha-2 adrenergic receptor-like [Strongylocentrotus purpuratus]
MADKSTLMMLTYTQPTVSLPDDDFNDNTDYSERIIFSIVFIVISITGIVGNTLVILAIVLSRKLRSTTNWFVLNLACVDLLTCVFLIFYVVAVLRLEVLSYTGWLLAWAVGITFTSMLSLTTHALIGFTSWYLIIKNYAKAKKLFTTRNISIMVAFSWLITIILCIVLFLTGAFSEYAAHFVTGIWIVGHFAFILTVYIQIWRFVAQQEKEMASKRGFGAKAQSETEMTTTNACEKSVASDPDRTIRDATLKPTPLSAECVSVEECGQSSSHPTSPADVSPREGKATTFQKQTAPKLNRKTITVTKNLLVILIAFTVCFIPYSICMFIPDDSLVEHWLLVLLFSNSCINPIIYARRIRIFREVMVCIIRCRLGTIPMPITFLRRMR